jgi:hypothetical protein
LNHTIDRNKIKTGLSVLSGGGRMARRQNFCDRIGMAVYEKKNLNKKLVTMQKSFQEVKHLIGNEKKKK